jgi:tRNA pseudouridine55 synthase
MNFTKGEVIAINKPLDMTSFSALAYVRKRLCMRLGVKKLKVGHAGTLDPLATGVLVLCTGSTAHACARPIIKASFIEMLSR